MNTDQSNFDSNWDSTDAAHIDNRLFHLAIEDIEVTQEEVYLHYIVGSKNSKMFMTCLFTRYSLHQVGSRQRSAGNSIKMTKSRREIRYTR